MALPRALKLTILVPFAALAVYVLFVAGMRLRGPTAEQAAALRVLQEPIPPVRGRDGSDAIWLLPYDVPSERRAAAADQLRDYFDRRDALIVAKRTEEAARLPNPMAAFERLPQTNSQTPGLCPEKTSDCLARVHAMPEQFDETLRQHEAGLRRALELADYDGFRHGLTISSSSELPQLAPYRLLVRTHFARQFDLGRTHAAMAGLCRDIAGWRRLGADHDHLVGSMVAVAYAKNDLTLMAEMLADWPASTELPRECGNALAAFADAEKGVCLPAKTEFRMVESAWKRELIAGIDNRTGKVLAEMAIDEDQALAVVAPNFARFCWADAVRMADRDRAWRPQPRSCSVGERIADPVGCVLVQIAGEMDMERYANRRIDFGAQLALMRTVVWLRAQSLDPASWPALLPKRPASLGLKREPKISADGLRISIPLLDTSRDEEFSLALPVVSKSVTPADATARSSQ